MSSMTTPPAKLTLPSTSSMSLHDRFTKLAKVAPKVQQASSVNVVSKSPLASTRASAKNRQLALQMANRPSVQAALKLKNKSIRQRLGVNTSRPINNAANTQVNNVYKLRNTTNRNTLVNRNSGLNNQLGPRLAAAPLSGRLAGTARIDPARLGLNANANKPIIIRNRIGGVVRRGGGRGGGVARGGRRSLDSANGNNFIRRVGAGSVMKGRGMRGRLNNSFGGNTNTRRNTNGVNNQVVNTRRGGMRGGRGRRGIGGRGGSAPGQMRPKAGHGQAPKSRENLDMDLDQYMAKSKNHLDADLDTYMQQSSA